MTHSGVLHDLEGSTPTTTLPIFCPVSSRKLLEGSSTLTDDLGKLLAAVHVAGLSWLGADEIGRDELVQQVQVPVPQLQPLRIERRLASSEVLLRSSPSSSNGLSSFLNRIIAGDRVVRLRCLVAWLAMVTRTQALVLGFFLVVWVSLLVILVAAPDVYDQALNLPGGRGPELAVLAALSGLIGLLVVGVVRRWRWTFWLILVAFLFGVLRVPVALLQLTGVLAVDTPAWYVLYQGLLGVAQFGIGLAMTVGYRRVGPWGAS